MVRSIYAVLAIALMAVVACAGGDDESLADTSWRATAVQQVDGTLAPPLSDTALSAEFAADEVTGTAGCNSYFGPYTTDGDGFQAGPVGSTRRLCDPASVMDQEASFLDVLTRADRWARAGDTLELFVGDEVVAEFEALETPELNGTSWSLLAYNNGAEGFVSVAIGTEITMAFDATDAAGSAGCNDYSAPYEAGTDTLQLGQATASLRLCTDPEGVMEQEALFFQNFGLVTTYQIDAVGNLEMFDADRIRLLQFTPAG